MFRIAFCFVYVGDGFSKLGEYIVFEIPTFLLFTGVLHVLTLFLRLGQQKFDFFFFFFCLLVSLVPFVLTIFFSVPLISNLEPSILRGLRSQL